MTRGNEYKVGKDPQRVDEPKGVTPQRTVKDHALKLQVQRIVKTFDDPIEGEHWLAGVRFVQGYIEHGASLQEMSTDQLMMELAEEQADAVNYSLEVEARAQARKPSTFKYEVFAQSVSKPRT